MTPHDQLTHRHPGVSLADLRAELQREAGYRARVYPGRVEKAGMTALEATREQALIAALTEDVERMIATWCHQQKPARPEPVEGFTWHERRAAIVRELGYRRRFYPGWIERGRLTQAEAARQILLFAALQDIYDEGWDWTASNGTPPAFAKVTLTPAEADAQAEWSHHWQAVATARLPAPQEEMAL